MTPARWRKAIRESVTAAIGLPMTYGVDDCMLFVANIDLAVTGVDTAAAYRGRYKTKRGAARVMGKRGVAGAALAAAKWFKWSRIDPQEAKPGARGLVDTPEGPAAVIFDGTFWVGRKEGGVSACRTVIDGKCVIRMAWSV